MKKLLLLPLSLFLACDKDDEPCTSRAEIITAASRPKSLIVDELPVHCDTRLIDWDAADLKFGGPITLVRYLP